MRADSSSSRIRPTAASARSPFRRASSRRSRAAVWMRFVHSPRAALALRRGIKMASAQMRSSAPHRASPFRHSASSTSPISRTTIFAPFRGPESSAPSLGARRKRRGLPSRMQSARTRSSIIQSDSRSTRPTSCSAVKWAITRSAQSQRCWAVSPCSRGAARLGPTWVMDRTAPPRLHSSTRRVASP
jgi:hypothetical protein